MIRIGTGYDLHQLVEGRPLILGGVSIVFDKGFEAHSDGDVLTHAIIDALLGAAAAGNIGLLFPDTDPAYAGAESLELLRSAHAEVKKSGFTVVNIDATIVAEAPKLNPYLAAPAGLKKQLSDGKFGYTSLPSQTPFWGTKR